MRTRGDKNCRICDEPLTTIAEDATGIHIDCYFYGSESNKRVTIKEIGYGFKSTAKGKRKDEGPGPLG